jgi:Phage Head-Tail Attachment
MFTEDINSFFHLTDHAIDAEWTPSGGSAATIAGIFNDEYFEDVGGPVGVEGSQPVFVCAAASVPGVDQGDAIVIDSKTYSIINVRPDGTGIVDLILEG